MGGIGNPGVVSDGGVEHCMWMHRKRTGCLCGWSDCGLCGDQGECGDQGDAIVREMFLIYLQFSASMQRQ